MPDRNQSGDGRGIVILPQSVIDKIDQNKDNLSRAEFLESCLDALLESGEVPAGSGSRSGGTGRQSTADGVSREELDEFKRKLKEMQRSFVDLIFDLTVEPVTGVSKSEQDQILQRVKDLLEE